jgi:hypothetical protein
MEMFIVCLFSSVPLLLLVFGFMRSSRVLKRIGLLSYIGMVGIVFAVHWYFHSVYGFPFFLSLQESAVAIVVLFLMGVFFLLSVIIAHFKTPKSVRNTKAVSLFLLALFAHVSVLCFFLFPVGGKWEYANLLNRAAKVFEKEENIRDGKIRVELVFSAPRPCWRNCSDQDYRNLFMVKNYTNQPMHVQLKIEVFNARKEPLGHIESLEISLQPGEYRPVIAKETNEEHSVWDQWTFTSDEQVAYFRYWYDARPER